MNARVLHNGHLAALSLGCSLILGLLGGHLLAGCSNSKKSAPAPAAGSELATLPATPAATPAANPAANPAPRAIFAGDRKGPLRRRATSLAAEKSRACPTLANDRIYRFIESASETCPRPATAAEITALGDPYAEHILRQGHFPTSVAQIADAVSAHIPGVDPSRQSFVVGEGSQVPLSVAPRSAERDLRYVVTWKASSSANLPDIFLSAAPGGHSSFLQVIAWDDGPKHFNFYAYNDDLRVWSWAGNSTHAYGPDTRGHGCFDCHHNGMVIMKELRSPWNNWHSSRAAVAASLVPTAIAEETLFRGRAVASILEGIVEGYQSKYHNARIDSLINAEGTRIDGVPRLLESIISQSTVNLASSQKTSAGATPDVQPPIDFFVNSTLTNIVFPDGLAIDASLSRPAYNAYLTANRYRLVQSDATPGYQMAGSTNFAFLVPVYSAEDALIVRNLYSTSMMVNGKFVASVMMVDFQNPVFSTVRAGLSQYAARLPSGTWASEDDDLSDVPARFAALVAEAARSQSPCDPASLAQCTAEQQFLHFFHQTGDQWRTDAQSRIRAYVATLAQQAPTPAGLDQFMRRAVSLRTQLRDWPILGNLVEFSLLFPQSTSPAN